MNLEPGETVLAHYSGYKPMWYGIGVGMGLVTFVTSGGGIVGVAILVALVAYGAMMAQRHKATLTNRALHHTMFGTRKVPLHAITGYHLDKKVLVVEHTEGQDLGGPRTARRMKVGPLADAEGLERVLDDLKQGHPARGVSSREIRPRGRGPRCVEGGSAGSTSRA